MIGLFYYRKIFIFKPIRKLKFVLTEIHDQSANDWQCWAYSIATMLRTSLRLLLRSALADGDIDEAQANSLLKILLNINHHKTLRCEIMMVVFPIRLNTYCEAELSRDPDFG